ncbi:VaFE repeat-containing surface-anchored protein [Trueperella pecoris]|uniref:VaFE repeat-containing surface-anchored protein n=1 Tax=Trueperella pecoris TaxID=2733571 RepID=A0A7M1QWE9_9ACTO|nr:VaFE repeat-containing surface-anchored protein [Trueperella pecoris]QOR45477.1 VaFE repeat-containing surface-anchored protein [Trueperella pecoris]
MNHVESTQVRAQSKVSALLVALMVVVAGIASPSPAFAAEAWPGSQHQWLLDDGSKITFGAIAPPQGAPNGNPVYCIDLAKTQPGPDDVVSVATLSESKMWGPDELDLTTPQIAWLLAKYQNMRDTSTQVQLSYLIHANLEDTSPDRGGAWKDSQGAVDWMVKRMKATEPLIHEQAAAKAAEARSSAAVGYEKGQGGQSGAREGVVEGIGITNAAGEFVAGRDMTVTMSGPAVFKDTGTQIWKGTSQATPLTLGWRATGTGEVTFETTFNRSVAELAYLANPNTQTTIQYPSAKDPEFITVPGNTWKVIYDFQPMGTSDVVKVSDDGTFVDTFQAKADPAYGDGKWLELDAEQAAKHGLNAGLVPVTYRVTAYEAGLVPPQQAQAAPEGAKQIGEPQLITATGPGELTASFEGATPGFATVVWEVVKTDQPEAMRVLIHDDWADGYGVPSETVSVRHPIKIDSSAAIRETKSGTYLVDDLWVTGFPKDHTAFAGDDRFGADVADMTQTLLFFPDGLEVIEANADKAEVIGQITVPAKNGFYPTLGSTDFKVKTTAEGKAVPGTYVFVTSFEGDDRVKPMTTSVEDKREQFTITPEPEIHTTLMYKSTRGAVPAGKVELVDQVSYTNLVPGKEYTLTGTIMVKSTGKPLTDAEGKLVKTTAKFTPEKPNGTQDVVFTADLTGYAGEEIVAFEKLYEGDVELVVHADINDKDQTLKITKLHTSATDKADGDKVMEKKGTQTIVDKVCEHSGQLIPGTTYTITTTLMQDNGQPVLDKDGQPVTVTTPFIPATADECATVEVSFDASLVQGSKVVVFEDVLVDDVLIGVHHDLNDVEQTITFKDESRGDAGRDLAYTGASTGPIALVALGLICAGGLLIYRRKASSVEA